MAFFGLFGNYSKPGPGVNKDDDDEKSAFQRYFITYGRNFARLLKLNLIFLIPAIPIAALIVFLYFSGFVFKIDLSIALTSGTVNLSVDIWRNYISMFPLVFLYPFFAAMLVITKRLVNRKYVFLWSEYWTGVKENFLQFFLNALLCYFVYVLLSFSTLYYSTYFDEGIIYIVAYFFTLLLAIIFILMQLYVPLLIVSAKLKLKDIYKNSLLFSILGVGRNFLFALVVIIFAVISLLHEFLPMVSLVLFAFSFVTYSNAFIFYPLLDRYIFNPYQASENEEETKEEVKSIWNYDESEEQEQIFDDLG